MTLYFWFSSAPQILNLLLNDERGKSRFYHKFHHLNKCYCRLFYGENIGIIFNNIFYIERNDIWSTCYIGHLHTEFYNGLNLGYSVCRRHIICIIWTSEYFLLNWYIWYYWLIINNLGCIVGLQIFIFWYSCSVGRCFAFYNQYDGNFNWNHCCKYFVCLSDCYHFGDF